MSCAFAGWAAGWQAAARLLGRAFSNNAAIDEAPGADAEKAARDLFDLACRLQKTQELGLKEDELYAKENTHRCKAEDPKRPKAIAFYKKNMKGNLKCYRAGAKTMKSYSKAMKADAQRTKIHGESMKGYAQSMQSYAMVAKSYANMMKLRDDEGALMEYLRGMHEHERGTNEADRAMRAYQWAMEEEELLMRECEWAEREYVNFLKSLAEERSAAHRSVEETCVVKKGKKHQDCQVG